MAVKAIDRLAAPHAPPIVWTTARDLETLGTVWGQWAWERLFFAGLVAVIYCLGVGDPEALCSGWLGTPGGFTFHDEKVNGQDTSYPVSQYMEQWQAPLYAQRPPDHHDFMRLLPGGRDTIESLPRDILAGTPTARLTWHPFKRCGAAAFIKMGDSPHRQAGWAGWHSQK